MSEWHKITEAPPALSMIVVYTNHSSHRYCFCVAEELGDILKEFAECSHWKLVAEPPVK